MNDDEEILSFIADWVDPVSSMPKKFLLKLYPISNAVEMKEVASGRKYLRRTALDPGTVTQSDFFIGATVIILSRDLKITDFGDNSTRLLLEAKSEKILCVFTSSITGQMVSLAEDIGNLTLSELETMYINESNRHFLSSVCVGCRGQDIEIEHSYTTAIFRGENATASLTKAIKSNTAMSEKIGKDIFVVLDPNHCELYSDYISLRTKDDHTIISYESSTSCTCCVIKPHAIKEHKAGSIIRDITSRGFKINAMRSFHLDRTRASEFYEVYKGLKEFNLMVDELSSGTCLAMNVESAVEEFRNHVGPWDVEMAKSLYPGSIRAKFGSSIVKNSAHCTDLPEENINELSYFSL